MPSALYDIATGQFTIWEAPDDGGVERCIYSTNGYSGRGKCRNNPRCQHVKNEGPLPIGRYLIKSVRHYRFVEPVFRLVPTSGTVMHGRSGFLIHGDNPTHDASRGCIVLWKSARDAIAELQPQVLEVCASEPKART